MAGDSQATFSESVKAKIRDTYEYRCVICLAYASTSQCAHIIDAAIAGKQQLRNAVRLGVLPDNYQRNAEINGMVQCPTCHSHFTANNIVLSLPIPILQYLLQYVAHTPKAKRRPLHVVFDLLVDALHGLEVELPDARAIFPYLGLFTVVTLKPIEDSITTPYLPRISIIRGSRFLMASSNTSPSAKKAARIFEPKAINKGTPVNYGPIPLSPQDQAFNETCYWRLPVSIAAIFAALTERLTLSSFECEDIILATGIRDLLSLQSYNNYPLDKDAEGSEPSGGQGSSGSGGRGGGSGRGGGGSKRKDTGGKSSPSSGKGKKKARKASGVGDGTRDCGEPNEASDFPSQARSQSGHSHHQETTSSSCNPEDEALVQSLDAGSDNSDLGNSRSISAISPHDEDNPDQWRFGPSFTTNKIIFTARAVNLT